MKLQFLVFLTTLSASAAFANIGIQVPWQCATADMKIKVQIQNIPSLDIAKPPRLTILGIEAGGSARPSSLVEVKEVSGDTQYKGESVVLLLRKGSGDLRDANAAIEGLGSNLKLRCMPMFANLCGKSMKSSDGSDRWTLVVPNAYFPEEKTLVSTYELSLGKPDAFANLKHDKFFCLEGTFKTPSLMMVLRTLNKNPIQ